MERFNLDNLVPYTAPSAGWSDLHSNINLTWKDPNKSALQQLTVLINPKEFFGEFPFPRLSYDDPKFDPVGYWRARVWPHFTYWMIQTL